MGKLNRTLRAQLERKVSQMLAGPLADLQSRGWLPPALRNPSGAREAQADRMREVLERDRAMIDANPPSNTQVTGATSATQRTGVDVTHAVDVTPTESTPALTRRERTVCNEPIRTRTMAKVLVSQGHVERALSIYEALIAEGASDPALLEEAAALRSLQT